MSNRDLRLQKILSNDPLSDRDIKAYALESFATEIDYRIQTELLMKLILDHSSIAKRIERLNEELLQSRAMLSEAQEIAQLGRWDIHPTSGSMTWSKSMYDLLELDPSVPASSDLFFSLVHPDDLQSVTQMFSQMFITQEPWSTRYRLLMKNGTIKWIHLRLHARSSAEGILDHFYGTIQDITEMKKAEDELRRYSEHLEHMVEEKVAEISSSQMATIYALIKLAESRDDDTGLHIERTASFCRLLALQLQSVPEYSRYVTAKFVDTIYKASPLHDIGKVGIPDKILLKPGQLTDDEFAIMKTHVQVGHDTLATVAQQYDGNEFLKMGMEIALYHHEKWDGSGYPQGLAGDAIPLSARIMALADVYDALRSQRVYKEAFSHKKSVEIIRSGQGKHFDPLLVDLFVRHQDEFEALYQSIQ